MGTFTWTCARTYSLSLLSRTVLRTSIKVGSLCGKEVDSKHHPLPRCVGGRDRERGRERERDITGTFGECTLHHFWCVVSVCASRVWC